MTAAKKKRKTKAKKKLRRKRKGRNGKVEERERRGRRQTEGGIEQERFKLASLALLPPFVLNGAWLCKTVLPIARAGAFSEHRLTCYLEKTLPRHP